MMAKRNIGILLAIPGLLLLLSSCRMRSSNYMNEEEHRQLETAYDSLHNTYKALMERYQVLPDSMPEELQSMYSQMQKMHRRMENAHQAMMAGDMNMDGPMRGNKNGMMANRMKMMMQMRSHQAGEWYSQMKSMHERMVQMHEKMEQQGMARMNRRLSNKYSNMMKMTPGLDKPSDVPFNEKGDPSLLNGEALFAQNCASCHGTNAEGMGNTFPPLVDSEWITGDKSVPICILLHGLTGQIEVKGQYYQGVMPSFRARLSAAEMAAILNYLRAGSKGNQSNISQEEVIQVAKTYKQRTKPWSAEGLNIK